MMSWYEALRNLTEKSPQERQAFVKQHARNISGGSHRAGSMTSGDSIIDEEDEEPFASAGLSNDAHTPEKDLTSRPIPGGRFPSSDILATRQAQYGLQVSHSLSSDSQILEHDDEAKLPATNKSPKVSRGSLAKTSEAKDVFLPSPQNQPEKAGITSPGHSSPQQQGILRFEPISGFGESVIKDDRDPEESKQLLQVDSISPKSGVECTRDKSDLFASDSIPSIIPSGSSQSKTRRIESPLSCDQAHIDGSKSHDFQAKSDPSRGLTREDMVVCGQIDNIDEASGNLHIPGEWDKTTGGVTPRI